MFLELLKLEVLKKNVGNNWKIRIKGVLCQVSMDGTGVQQFFYNSICLGWNEHFSVGICSLHRVLGLFWFDSSFRMEIKRNSPYYLHLSSNINEVIRSVLNFCCFFFTKRFHKYKKAQNIKNVYKKHLSSNIKSSR